MEPAVTNAVHLPDWVTAVGSVLVFLTTFGFAAYGWIKAKFPTSTATPTGSAVVLSAAIADSASINKLATAIEAMMANDNLNRIELQLIARRLEGIHDELCDLIQLLKDRQT